MIISIASGKGGTGKTTVATNLASSISNSSITFIDCDVEEPNSHLFLRPAVEKEQTCLTFIPKVDTEKCTLCGKCSELCQFKAIVKIADTMLVFPELCHGCEGCKLICPVDAISDDQKQIGTISVATSGRIRFVGGRLKIGEALSPPLIREVIQTALKENKSDINIIDSPPGTSCPVIESIKVSDFVVLVTEPTPFGLNDLRLAVETVRVLGIPFGVVINRSTIGNNNITKYCDEQSIPILLEIPDDRKIAEAYSRGYLIIDHLPQYKSHFELLLDNIKKISDSDKE